MKKLILLLGMIAVMSSCSKYYISTLNSPEAKKDESTGQLIFENDSISIAYNFYGANAPVSIAFYNKLNEPIYINWEQSALINNEKASSYLGENITVTGQVSGESNLYFKNYTTSDASISATAVLPKGLSFIPPKSRIIKVPLHLSIFDYKNIPDSSFSRVSLDVIGKSTGIFAKKIDFNNINTPLTFKSYITFYTVTSAIPKPMTVQQTFYLSNLIKTSINPKSLVTMEKKPGNVFYLSGKTMPGNPPQVVDLKLRDLSKIPATTR